MSNSPFVPHPNRLHWDARYRESYAPRPPSSLLQRQLLQLAPGRALDLACGTGRNTILLAEYGWQALGVDISPVALHIARREARNRNVAADFVAANLQAWPLPLATFDLVCVFRFLDRALTSSITAAVKRGGVLIYETFTIAQRAYEGGPRADAFLLQPGELPSLFPAFTALEYTEGVVEEDGRLRALAGFVGRRT